MGKLIHFLKANGLWDETLFIFASDHGEEFGEHGWIGHSTTLYEESLRVPLVMAGRGAGRGKRVQMPVGLLDVAPTILASCGLDVPETMFGSPLDLTGEKRPAPRRLFSALTLPDGPMDLTQKKFALRDPRGMKLVETSFLGQLDGQPTKTELYDLRSDPGETGNLADGNPQSVAILSGEIERLGKLTASRENEAYTVSESTMKVLESLGYLR